MRTDIGGLAPHGYRGTDFARSFPGYVKFHAPYGPAELQAAYGITEAARTRGAGQIIAVVDVGGYHDAESELATYRKKFGLPPCTAKNGCFIKVNQQGKAGPYPPDDLGWSVEASLDMDMVSAICPKCSIMLVEPTTYNPHDIDESENTAARLGASAISNSYGCSCDAAAFSHKGVAITGSSGDSGATGYLPSSFSAGGPCGFPDVICVGGTRLLRAVNARGWNEVVWNGVVVGTTEATGSGCIDEAKPAWQTDKGCSGHSYSDISADADPTTGVAIFAEGFWLESGGTSASSPMIAAMYGLAGNSRTIDAPAYLWQYGERGAFNDVTLGNDVTPDSESYACPAEMHYICYARIGYDGPTGWGTPHGLAGF